MKLNKWIKVALIGSSILTLAACSSHKKPDQNAINAANAAYANGAESSGVGHEAGFGDSNGEQVLSKRVYYFDYDSNVVHEDDRAAVMANANYIAAHPGMQVILEGHTDPRGSREYNIGLGERRANAIAAMLTAKGVNRAQIRVVSYGAEKANPGRSEHDFQLDRRVVLVYLKR